MSKFTPHRGHVFSALRGCCIICNEAHPAAVVTIDADKAFMRRLRIADEGALTYYGRRHTQDAKP